MIRNKFWIGFSVSAYLLFFIFSCTKIKTTDIGSDLLPVVDNIYTFDTTLEVITENGIDKDSAYPRLAKAVNSATPETMLGYISNDPQFGQSTGTMYMQLYPNNFPWTFEVKDSLYLDSVVLCLRWTGNIQGDTNLLQKIDVYALDSTLNPDSSYRTDVSIPYTELLGSKTFAPSILNDSLHLFRQNLNNQLRIRLSDAFGNALLAQAGVPGGAFTNDTTFQKFLKGYALVPDKAGAPTANALMGFSISDTNTYLRIYYRYDTAATRDTSSRTLRYSYYTGFANNITRDHTGSQLANSATPGADSLVYIQTSPGSYSMIRIPGLAAFKQLKGNVLIHKAEISMQQIPSSGEGDDKFYPPDILYIDYLDTVDYLHYPFLEDGFPSNTYTPDLLGGKRKWVDGPGGSVIAEYRFNIARYMQGIITRNNPIFPIYLYSPYYIRYPQYLLYNSVNTVGKGRVKLGGGSSKQRRMVLRIIYSKI